MIFNKAIEVAHGAKSVMNNPSSKSKFLEPRINPVAALRNESMTDIQNNRKKLHDIIDEKSFKVKKSTNSQSSDDSENSSGDGSEISEDDSAVRNSLHVNTAKRGLLSEAGGRIEHIKPGTGCHTAINNQNSLGALMSSRKKKDRKRKKHKKHKNKVVETHKREVDCAAWGCTCKLKAERKAPPTQMAHTTQQKPAEKERRIYTKLEKDYGNKKTRTTNAFGVPKSNAIKNKYPVLYAWDQKQQQKVMSG